MRKKSDPCTPGGGKNQKEERVNKKKRKENKSIKQSNPRKRETKFILK